MLLLAVDDELAVVVEHHARDGVADAFSQAGGAQAGELLGHAANHAVVDALLVRGSLNAENAPVLEDVRSGRVLQDELELGGAAPFRVRADDLAIGRVALEERVVGGPEARLGREAREALAHDRHHLGGALGVLRRGHQQLLIEVAANDEVLGLDRDVVDLGRVEEGVTVRVGQALDGVVLARLDGDDVLDLLRAVVEDLLEAGARRPADGLVVQRGLRILVVGSVVDDLLVVTHRQVRATGILVLLGHRLVRLRDVLGHAFPLLLDLAGGLRIRVVVLGVNEVGLHPPRPIDVLVAEAFAGPFAVRVVLGQDHQPDPFGNFGEALIHRRLGVVVEGLGLLLVELGLFVGLRRGEGADEQEEGDGQDPAEHGIHGRGWGAVGSKARLVAILHTTEKMASSGWRVTWEVASSPHWGPRRARGAG